jgi:hypothetical protein
MEARQEVRLKEAVAAHKRCAANKDTIVEPTNDIVVEHQPRVQAKYFV